MDSGTELLDNEAIRLNVADYFPPAAIANHFLKWFSYNKENNDGE